jgi:hypothetical protein
VKTVEEIKAFLRKKYDLIAERYASIKDPNEVVNTRIAERKAQQDLIKEIEEFIG